MEIKVRSILLGNTDRSSNLGRGGAMLLADAFGTGADDDMTTEAKDALFHARITVRIGALAARIAVPCVVPFHLSYAVAGGRLWWQVQELCCSGAWLPAYLPA